MCILGVRAIPAIMGYFPAVSIIFQQGCLSELDGVVLESFCVFNNFVH